LCRRQVDFEQLRQLTQMHAVTLALTNVGLCTSAGRLKRSINTFKQANPDDSAFMSRAIAACKPRLLLRIAMQMQFSMVASGARIRGCGYSVKRCGLSTVAMKAAGVYWICWVIAAINSSAEKTLKLHLL